MKKISSESLPIEDRDKWFLVPTCGGRSGLPSFPFLPLTKKRKAKKGKYYDRFGKQFGDSILCGAYHSNYRKFKKDAHKISKRFNINFKVFKRLYGI